MFASNLESLLLELVGEADVSRRERSDMAKRFDSLRRYGRLPRGRGNHAAILTHEEIASAIFGLASDRPEWAGHIAIVLGKLVPIGGTAAAISDTTTLIQALQVILSSEPVRGNLVNVTLSSAESGKNANGHATSIVRRPRRLTGAQSVRTARGRSIL